MSNCGAIPNSKRLRNEPKGFDLQLLLSLTFDIIVIADLHTHSTKNKPHRTLLLDRCRGSTNPATAPHHTQTTTKDYHRTDGTIIVDL
jgi:hypothetical protein